MNTNKLRKALGHSVVTEERVIVLGDDSTCEIESIGSAWLYFCLPSNMVSICAARFLITFLKDLDDDKLKLLILDREHYEALSVQLCGGPQHGVGDLLWLVDGQIVKRCDAIQADFSDIQWRE